ncbi:hypothetical protein SE951_12640 [Escherichia coli]|nr:hypothetical protein [Escherichia coli]
MPASKEDLRLKLMEVVNALSESQGSTPQEIIEILNAIPAQDFIKRITRIKTSSRQSKMNPHWQKPRLKRIPHTAIWAVALRPRLLVKSRWITANVH